MKDEEEQGIEAIEVEKTTRLSHPVELPLLENLWQQTLDWQPTAQQYAQFQQLYELILAGNRQFNLTRITEPTEFWEKHLWDSLRGVRRLWESGGNVSSSTSEAGGRSVERSQESEPEEKGRQGDREAGKTDVEEQGEAEALQLTDNQKPTTLSTQNSSRLIHRKLKRFKVIDIGTGAGFPGIPVAIAQPTWTVTLLDSTRKKINFLDQLLASLNLNNAVPLVARVEQLGRQAGDRETYDLALVRAVAAASVCAEYALPLLKIGGTAVLYRGHWTDAETAPLEAAVATLGGVIDTIEAFTTPLSHSDRHCLCLRKIAPTPDEFPRAIGIPTQNPL